MARRPTLRTNVGFERLESREVLTSGGPTAEVQELLELANFAREKPVEAANWAVADLQTDNLGVTLKTFGLSPEQARNDVAARPAAPPLAWSPQLSEAATVLSRAQAERGVQSHDGGGTLADGTPVGLTLGDRLSNARYDEALSQGENAFAYARSARNATKAFLLEWGNDRKVLPHLANLMNPAQREAGFGVVETRAKGLGPKVVTQLFGSRAGARPMLVGVAFNDVVEADRRYQAGEGAGDVAIDVTDEAGATQTVKTWDSGGYQVPLGQGKYKVTARVGDKVVRSQAVEVGDRNVKVDFLLSDPWAGGTVAPPKPVEVAPKPVPVIVEAPKPIPEPVKVEAPKVEAPKVEAPKPAPAPETPVTEVVEQVVTSRDDSKDKAVAAGSQGSVAANLYLLAVSDLSNSLNSKGLSWQSW